MRETTLSPPPAEVDVDEAEVLVLVDVVLVWLGVVVVDVDVVVEELLGGSGVGSCCLGVVLELVDSLVVEVLWLTDELSLSDGPGMLISIGLPVCCGRGARR